jgi:cyclopropane-fatty-acyl-phospholipid synthase
MDFLTPEEILTKNISDTGIRRLIRYGCSHQLRQLSGSGMELSLQKKIDFINDLIKSPIAVEEKKANEEHYEVPAEFFGYVLGKKLKYSACFWDDGVSDLNQAEDKMLELICQRADLQDGQNILDLGCGWGSVSLYIAQKYPHAKITGISNSNSQKQYILEKAKKLGLSNLHIVTNNIAEHQFSEQFDRIVSIEMLEHMRNYQLLFYKISQWMRGGAQFFVHIFSHIKYAYFFKNNWTAKNFFSGGTMPSDDLFLYFQKHLTVTNHWRLSGTHYQKTSEAWLKNLDKNREAILSLFKKLYGDAGAMSKLVMWRLFFIVCSESFGFNQGQEWLVSHYVLEKT